MKKLSAVIGANFGDEGKGHIVDYLSDPDTLVVRFSGGAQAGHTVVLSDGRRHVFHHFGSGTLAGARTFLAPHFLVNPIKFVTEYKELRDLGVEPKVYVDPSCHVTTPWDMLLNQGSETLAGKKRMGSCGLGIHETMLRAETKYQLRVMDLTLPTDMLQKRLLEIRSEWSIPRAQKLGIAIDVFKMDGLLDHYLDDCYAFTKISDFRFWGPGLRNYLKEEHICFEGAQGLRLDEQSPYFPHVTHARTGLTNVVKLLRMARREEKVDVYYVTRPYITRHGAGPLPNELPLGQFRDYFPNFRDDTNVENEWQERLRYSLFERTEFRRFVLGDLASAQRDYRPCFEAHVAFTCLDHMGKELTWMDDEQTFSGSFEMFRRSAWYDAFVLLCYGPTSEDVKPLTPCADTKAC